MFKPLAVLGISLMATACAGTTQVAKAGAEECKLVDHEETGSHIAVKQECTAAPGGPAAGAPQP